jgi:hypothetical protein
MSSQDHSRRSGATATAAATSWEVTSRISRHAYDRLTLAGPLSAVGVGTVFVWTIAALEGALHLKQDLRSRFILRYATYNVLPSLIWATQSTHVIIETSPVLSQTAGTANNWLFHTNQLPPRRALWVNLLAALRGAVAGSVLLSNVIAITSIWQDSRQDYAQRIQNGKEPPLRPSQKHGVTIRLAGVQSDVTELSLQRRRHHLWPVFEKPEYIQHLVKQYGSAHKNTDDARPALPQRPMYWQVRDGQYSKAMSWDGMIIPKEWLYTTSDGRTLLYLEADATSGDESALALQHHGEVFRHMDNSSFSWWKSRDSSGVQSEPDSNSTTEQMHSDLDLKEVSQGFRRLADIARRECESKMQVVRVLLVDPSTVVENGGGRRSTVRDQVTELGLADIIVDSRQAVLHSILSWLRKNDRDTDSPPASTSLKLKPVILETPSKEWFHSIQTELRNHQYDVMDRESWDISASATTPVPPMLVYERSSADTIHTIRVYLERGIVQDPTMVCALLPCHDGLEEIQYFENNGESSIGCVCASDIYDCALEWVRNECLKGKKPEEIQCDLDAGNAWGVRQV